MEAALPPVILFEPAFPRTNSPGKPWFQFRPATQVARSTQSVGVLCLPSGIRSSTSVKVDSTTPLWVRVWPNHGNGAYVRVLKYPTKPQSRNSFCVSHTLGGPSQQIPSRARRPCFVTNGLHLHPGRLPRCFFRPKQSTCGLVMGGGGSVRSGSLIHFCQLLGYGINL